MRKPYTKRKDNTDLKAQQLLTIENHGINDTQYRKMYKLIEGKWALVGLGCRNCNKSYQSLMSAVSHISKCKRRAINSLTEDD